MRQLHAGGPSGLLGTGASGSLWALSLKGQAPRRIANGIDAATPIATGHGRIAARTADGGLWVWENAGGGRARTSPPSLSANLSPHAGLLILPLAVLAVVTASARPADPLGHRLARFEPDPDGRWREVARSTDTVLPDARPVQVDLDGRGDGGHIAVLAGPDGSRYDHGVLGDAIEATRVLWLERHGLDVLRDLSLAAPHVFEDIAPRPVVLPGAPVWRGLLTVRSGPDGGQLALVTADPARPQGLRLAALGDTVGGFHRWLAPTTDGRRLVAVHTPHIGGVLHIYQPDGERLTRRRLHADVSTHRIGTREVDLAAWVQGLLILPSQDGRQLRLLNPAAGWAEVKAVALPGRATLTAAVPDAAALAVLLDGGQVVLVGNVARGASRG
ncbi:hypothetical protein BurJ1DRAFT_2401 [Burkholderiales bacterium JOSHI_001]|nr:hypothetical protein BurJ1DRAFT_2401 [Burkholderiales bacterium JOSHI_001]